MKNKLFLILFLVSITAFSQSVNDYAAVIVPTKFDFQKEENEYRLSTITKYNLETAGFKAVYSNTDFSVNYPNRCSLLSVDLIKDSGLLTTKLYVAFKDCYGKVIYTSEVGKSKEKDFASAYREALQNAFISVNKLGYKYSGKPVNISNQFAQTTVVSTSAISVPVSTPDNEVLYAQPTETGFQLIDNTPKVVMKLLKTAMPNSYIAIKGENQGVLNFIENQWIFDYYTNDKLVSEIIAIKF